VVALGTAVIFNICVREAYETDEGNEGGNADDENANVA
jgi:hypothetical protein